jgi:NADP-dependent 3-hydroxy acid dehydrogenase YdfG
MEVRCANRRKGARQFEDMAHNGASSGLGFALARYVLEQGDCAVLGARNLRRMSELVAHYPDTGLALTLDVTSEDRAAAIVQTEGRFGGIDVLVNNAGIDFSRRH